MFKVRFKERLFIIFFACFLAIYPPTVKYQEVQALEWVIPTIGFDTAFKFLLGLLGVSITSKALHDNVDWGQVRQDCMDYQIQKGNDAVAVGKWWEDVAKGTLNQASACWSAFKEWVQSKLEDSSSGGGSGVAIDPEYFLKSILSTYGGYTFTNDFKLFDPSNISVYSAFISFNGSVPSIYLITNNYPFTISNYGSGIRINNANYMCHYVTLESINVTNKVISSIKLTRDVSVGGIPFTINDSIDTAKCYIFNLINNSTYAFNNISSLPSSDSIFDSANDNVTDTAITTDDTTTTAIPGTIPLPWDNVSDTAEGVSDAIDALQEQVAEGVLSLEDYWERVQEMVNALAIDTDTDETLPVTQNPDTGETEKLPDIVQDNVSNTAFTLNGLEKVFPFCIPWDIYGFVTLLVAEPVAPVINYPIYNPVTNKDINITIDFSEWETVVVLFRYILDFLLIIGLLLLARQLSGAGGDD